MTSYRALVCVLFAACRFDPGGIASDGGVTPRDLGSLPDTMPDVSPDVGQCGADAGICCGEADGRRVCNAETNSSAMCSSGVTVDDRECPPDSDCEGFVCALRSACRVCGSGCGAGEMCSIFVTTEGSNTCCTPCFGDERGCGSPGTRCGASSDCASGVCVENDGGTSDGGESGQCYVHCQTPGPSPAECGAGGVCEARLLRVDGLERVLLTCVVP